jgi:hypothetical protein
MKSREAFRVRIGITVFAAMAFGSRALLSDSEYIEVLSLQGFVLSSAVFIGGLLTSTFYILIGTLQKGTKTICSPLWKTDPFDARHPDQILHFASWLLSAIGLSQLTAGALRHGTVDNGALDVLMFAGGLATGVLALRRYFLRYRKHVHEPV